MRRQRNLLGPQGMGGLVSLWGASSLIKSVQTGEIQTNTNPNTATINAVNTANSIICWQNCSHTTANTNLVVIVGHLALTNATTVTATQSSNYNSFYPFTVVEFLPGVLRSVQSALVTQSGFSVATTINAVNTAKSMLMFLGQTGGGGAPPADTYTAKFVLTNSTTVTSSTFATAGGFDGRFQVIEFF